MKRVRIYNDSGKGYLTKVTNLETGEDIPNVTGISLSIEPRREIRATIETALPVVDVVAMADLSTKCPLCHQHVPIEPFEIPPIQKIGSYEARTVGGSDGFFVEIEDEARNGIRLDRNNAKDLCAYLQDVFNLKEV